MAMQKVTKPGNVQITPVGHTTNGKFGSEPNAKVRGRSEQPTPQTFGKG
jgi:hypothetical protein